MVHQITPFQEPHDGASAEQAYFKNDSLHPLPIEVWRLIGEFVSTGATPLEAAKNSIQLGKVNPFFHAYSWTVVNGVDGFNPTTTVYDHWGKQVSKQKRGGARM